VLPNASQIVITHSMNVWPTQLIVKKIFLDKEQQKNTFIVDILRIVKILKIYF